MQRGVYHGAATLSLVRCSPGFPCCWKILTRPPMKRTREDLDFLVGLTRNCQLFSTLSDMVSSEVGTLGFLSL